MATSHWTRRSTKGETWVFFSLILALGATEPARAQSVGFDPADYGRAQLPLRQTTGDAATYVDRNKGAFEPIAELDPRDGLAALARPIGRVVQVQNSTRIPRPKSSDTPLSS